MSDIAIKVKNLSKTFKIPQEQRETLRHHFWNFLRPTKYKKFEALKDISFEIKKGEWFGIIGRNGSGKSTLLKILAGIYRPDTGQIVKNGKIVPFLELGIGFNNELTARENIFLNGTILGITRKELEKKFDEIVDFAEIRYFLNTPLKNYSSGMQVRLAFSIAIHANSDILLMDEVLAVGDTNFQSKCMEEFNKYKDAGKTIILVTHDISTVQKYCDRAMLLREGKVEMIGDPEDVGNKYINQNMSDEEKRLANHNENGQTQENNRGETKREKIAEITKVEFLDKDGKAKNVFETGNDVSIRVYFKKNKPVENLNFSIAIFNQENDYAFGVHTFSEKIDVKRFIDRGYYQVNYKNFPLRTDTYYINSAIYGEDYRIAYDFMPKSKLFKVFSRDKNYGMVNIDCHWS